MQERWLRDIGKKKRGRKEKQKKDCIREFSLPQTILTKH